MAKLTYIVGATVYGHSRCPDIVILIDMFVMSIKYFPADPYNTYTMYNPADICWHVLNNIMSEYYLCYYHIFWLNALCLKQKTQVWQAAAVSDEPSIEPEQLMPGFRSSTPEILFVPLNPPPLHQNSHKPDSIIGPDDPRNLEEPLCVYCTISTVSS
jgi:hypothetical protein